MPKNSPHTVAELAIDGVEADAPEILVDDLTRRVKAVPAADLTAPYPNSLPRARSAASRR